MKHILSPLYTLLFFVAAVLFFGLAYPQHLHYQEQYQLFLFDADYMWDIIRLPGGIADLLGRFCTQFFLFAWVGALIIGVLLTLVQLLVNRLCNWGRLFGLTFVPSFILWIFLLHEHALLGGVWAVVLTLLVCRLFDLMHNNWMRRGLLVIAIPVLYWMAGPVCLLFFLLQAPSPKKEPWYYALFLLLALLPVLLPHYLSVSSGSLRFGIHYHRYPTEVATLLWAAVLSVFLLVLIARACRKWANTSPASLLYPFSSFLIVASVMGALAWKNADFKAERVMHYDFMACHQQWNRILETINQEKPNNQIGVTVQNLALAMRGLLADHMFEYRQNGIAGLLPDIESDATSPMPTAEALYQIGMINVAQRAVFEAQEAILDFQKSARCYKRLAQTNLINGNYAVASKYLMALQKTLFYRDWAHETLPLLGNEKAIGQHPEYGRLRQCAYKEDFFFADKVSPDMLNRLFFSNTDNRLAYDYLMAYYLLTGDLESFTNNVALGEKLGYPAIPRHFQEALILGYSLSRQKSEQLSAQISQPVAQRFKQFGSYINSPAMTPEGLAGQFGDTYWYYYLKTVKH